MAITRTTTPSSIPTADEYRAAADVLVNLPGRYTKARESALSLAINALNDCAERVEWVDTLPQPIRTAHYGR